MQGSGDTTLICFQQTALEFGFRGCLAYLPSADPLICGLAADCRSGKTTSSLARAELSMVSPEPGHPFP